MKQDLANEFEKVVGTVVKLGVLGSRHTTFAIGGPLQYLVEIESKTQLKNAINFFRINNQTWRVIGAGSNLLIADQGLSGWFLTLGKGFKYFSKDKNFLSVGASQGLMALSKAVSDEGLAGLEFAGGIPASIGGAVVMNAGAHHGELSQVLSSITVINSDAESVEISANQLSPSYRKGGVPKDCIVVEARFCLSESSKDKTSLKRAEHLAYRKKTQPLQSPSAGSVFRNPAPDKPAGFLIEQCGLKGKHYGEVLISELHANWIINPNKKGTAEEVKSLIKLCSESVSDRFKIDLIQEIVSWD